MSKILIILHQKHSTPGRVGEALLHRGFTLDIRRPRFGDPLPGTLLHHAGAIIFGGPMSANDSGNWLKRETDWIHVPLREEKPFLGICLGAQLMARHLGARVRAHAGGCVEAGYYPISPTAAGRALVARWPRRVYQWHREGFDLPRGAKLLARGGLFRNQAFSYGRNAHGIQFHPELTLGMMHRWTTRGAQMLTNPCAQSSKWHFDGRMRYDSALESWLHDFLDTWLGDVTHHPHPYHIPYPGAAKSRLL